MELDLSRASLSDELSDTVDYGAIGNLVESAIVGPPFALLEKLAGTIAETLLVSYLQIEKVSVTVHKPNAPLDVKFGDVAVTVIRSK